jgi:hypothetical protein
MAPLTALRSINAIDHSISRCVNSPLEKDVRRALRARTMSKTESGAGRKRKMHSWHDNLVLGERAIPFSFALSTCYILLARSHRCKCIGLRRFLHGSLPPSPFCPSPHRTGHDRRYVDRSVFEILIVIAGARMGHLTRMRDKMSKKMRMKTARIRYSNRFSYHLAVFVQARDAEISDESFFIFFTALESSR